MSKTILRICRSPQEAWDGVLHDWFRESAATAWQRSRPSLIIVPTRSHAQGLKALLLQANQSQLGLEFVTPAGLRAHFAAGSNLTLAPREHLRLLLALAAEFDSETQAAKAIIRAPNPLLRTLDRLEAAGWDFEALQLAVFQPIVRRFREYLHTANFTLGAELDRTAFQLSRDSSPLFANILITGFDGAHWPLMLLLQATTRAAEEATVVLSEPREEAHDLDAAWVGTWEENYGEAQPLKAT
ncbi:MAG: hypothetical protein M3Y03_06475, partial [Verrucomicrobiota bacterium]|nr:hypothetical protein [Verrucomicrobiota bacterium]